MPQLRVCMPQWRSQKLQLKPSTAKNKFKNFFKWWHIFLFRVLHDTVVRDLTSTLWHRVFTRGNLRNQFGSLWPTGENGDIEEKIPKVIVVDVLFHKKILFSYRCIILWWIRDKKIEEILVYLTRLTFVASCSSSIVSEPVPILTGFIGLAQDKGLHWPGWEELGDNWA